MSRNRKKLKKPAPVAPVQPAWDKETWMSLANIRLGVPAFVIAGALHDCKAGMKLTEVEVQDRLQAFLKQSL